MPLLHFLLDKDSCEHRLRVQPQTLLLNGSNGLQNSPSTLLSLEYNHLPFLNFTVDLLRSCSIMQITGKRVMQGYLAPTSESSAKPASLNTAPGLKGHFRSC